LHLNPGLLQGLPAFYHQHIGLAHNNQLWLVTHSDALLRQAVRDSDFSVYHMRTATSIADSDNQAQRIEVDSALERAVVDLVGDLATYKPHARNLICEGAGDTAFDVFMISRLFPELAQRVNLLSGGSRNRVRDLYTALSELGPSLGQSFSAIVDSDTEELALPETARVRHWDRYHIENYLLEPQDVVGALQAVLSHPAITEPALALSALRACAGELVPELVVSRVRAFANDRLVRAIRVGGDPQSTGPAAATLRPSIEGSCTRFSAAAQALLVDGELEREEACQLTTLRDALASEDWISIVPGRSILKRFVDRHASGVGYEVFRNVIVAQMAQRNFEPEGMARVLAEAVA
jgi:hypothetical protein